MIKRILFLSALMLGATFGHSQKINVELLKGMKIRNIGPAGMSGRVTAIDVDLSNPERIFAGTASGGVWLSENGGITWKPIFDKQPLQSVGSLAINQKNPSEIWVGTGEGNPRNSLNSGEGIYKSIDGGKTWKLMGLTKTKLIHRIIVHRDNPDIIYVGALGSTWGNNKERGVFKTTDGGKSWRKVLYFDEETGCGDLVVDPSNPNKLIAGMWTFGRKPWFFNSGGKNSGLHISYDGGENWKRLTDKDGLPKGDLGRMGLSFSASKPNIVYALIEAKVNGLYKSTDGGNKWKLVSNKNVGSRPFYYADIFVDPKNENRIFNLHSTMTISEDGGKTFRQLLGYVGFDGVHPDHHAFWIHPENPNYIIEGNDGGLNISRDGGKNWRFVSNLPLAQFYHINYDMDFPYNVMGGMQDNGSWVGPSAVLKRGGIKNADWQEIFFGDGFDVMLRPDDNRYGYAMSQGGNLAYIDRVTGQSRSIRPFHPEGKELRYNWNAALAQDPFSNCGIYYGSQYVHYSTDCGQSWEIISPDLTTNDEEKQQQDKSGGLTKDVTGAENFTTIVSIAPSPVDKQVIWVGTDDGNLQMTKDGGKNWSNVANRLPGFPKGAWIPQVEVSTKNAGEAFIVVNDYRRNNWTPYAYHTTDYGATFRRIVDGNKVKGHTLSIVQDLEVENLLFLGTDYGLYFSIDKGNTWNKWMNDYPSVPTQDLKIHPRERDLIVGTFGRAAWILDDIEPLRQIAKSGGRLMQSKFKVFEPRDAYFMDYRSVDGARFIADAEFVGQNRSFGGVVNLWVQHDKKKDSPKGKQKEAAKKKQKESKKATETKQPKKPALAKDRKLKVQVYNMEEELVRTFTKKIAVDTGIVQVNWGLNKDGIRFPSYQTPKKDADKPGGINVLPGKYKLVFTYGDFKDSTMMNVKNDPRSKVSMADLKAKQKGYEEYFAVVKKATEAFDRMKDSKKTIKRINEMLTNAPDSIQTQFKKKGKEITGQIDSLMLEYMFPPDTKGIQRSANQLNSYQWRIYSYLNSSDGAPNQMARFALDHFKRETQRVLDKVNTFYQEKWTPYRKEFEATQYSLFKDYEPIKLK